jgi:hypothetical protein
MKTVFLRLKSAFTPGTVKGGIKSIPLIILILLILFLLTKLIYEIVILK